MSENNFPTSLLKLPYVKPQLLELELNKLIKSDKVTIAPESNNGNLS